MGILAVVAHERGLSGVLKSAGIALVTLVVVDAGLFRSGLYDYCVELDSSVGGVVQAISSDREDSSELVAVVGDSQVAEGFAERVFDDVMRGKERPLRALNLGISGSSLRVWALLLERMDPQADRFRFVVIPLGQFVGCDQAIDKLLVGAGAIVEDEGRHHLRSGRHPAQVKREPANQRCAIGFG